MKKIIALLIATACMQANAAPLFSNTGLSNTVTFDEVPLAQGVIVTNQFAAQGVEFSTTAPGNLYASGNPGVYSGNTNFSGNYLDSFSGGSHSSEYSIHFGSLVSAAGAYFEFNPGTSNFSSYLGGALQESYIYTNSNCCNSAEFVGFSGNFDEIRLNAIQGDDFILDNLSFTAKDSVPVSEPTSIALLGLGLLGFTASRRKSKK